MVRTWRAGRGTCAVSMVALTMLVFHPASRADAQDTKYRYTIDEHASLAWWQISPHLNHLWATTCPQDHSWQPGDERSSGWAFDIRRVPSEGHANIVDTVHVPLYPRPVGKVESECTPAVRGQIVASDTIAWRGVKGLVLIRADAFVTGLSARDEYARKAVLQAPMYPDIRFHLDSLIEVQPGDTVKAKAVGRFVFHGVTEQEVVWVKAWKEAGGLRVTGKFNMLPTDLIEKYSVSRLVLGLGVGTAIWKILHLGFDIILRTPET